jgi:hypothetical protein
VTDPTRRQLREAARVQRSRGLAQAGKADFSLAQAVGGPRGVVEAVLPGLLYVVVFTATRDLKWAIAVSVGAAVLAVLARVVTRSSPSQALAGVVGVVVCALVAKETGEARDYYVPGFFVNIGSGLLYLASTIRFPAFTVPGTSVRVGPGPFPVLGVVIGLLTGEHFRWRHDPARLRAYQRVTWLFAALFAARLLVQVPLYFANQVGALGIARLVMGLPLFALAVWITWLVLRAVPPARPDDEPGPDQADAGVVSMTKDPEVSRGQGSVAS